MIEALSPLLVQIVYALVGIGAAIIFAAVALVIVLGLILAYLVFGGDKPGGRR